MYRDYRPVFNRNRIVYVSKVIRLSCDQSKFKVLKFRFSRSSDPEMGLLTGNQRQKNAAAEAAAL